MEQSRVLIEWEEVISGHDIIYQECRHFKVATVSRSAIDTKELVRDGIRGFYYCKYHK